MKTPRLVFWMIGVLLAAAAFSGASLDRRVHAVLELHRPMSPGGGSQTLRLPLAAPVPLDIAGAQSLSLRLNGYGADHVGVLTVRSLGAPPRVVVRSRGVGDERTTCAAAPGGSVAVCRVVARLGAAPTLVLLEPDSATTTIVAVTYEAATTALQASASGAEVFYGFGLLLLLGPALVWLRRWPGVDQLVLIAAGLAWIGHAGLDGLAVSVFIVLAGHGLIKRAAAVKSGRGRTLALSVCGVLLLVALIKFAAPLMAAAFANPGGFRLALPLGLSYFAIRLVDLLLSAHAGTLGDFRLRDYLAFMLTPYTLPAGPIQLYGDFLRGRIEGYGLVDFAAGGARMGVGLAKKLLADAFALPLAAGHMNLFLTGSDPTHRHTVIMLLANLIYIYLDFSAYCDLAIGAARAGGRRLPENFNWPLARSGPRQYWRHWHITLSQWVMRRVYFPAFLSSRSTVVALTASMLAIGLWHAPNLPWTLWALHHSLAMAAEGRLFPAGRPARAPPDRSRLAPAARGLRYLAGVAFLWGWVALGSSFTLFSSPAVAWRSYVTALTSPFFLAKALSSPGGASG